MDQARNVSGYPYCDPETCWHEPKCGPRTVQPLLDVPGSVYPEGSGKVGPDRHLQPACPIINIRPPSPGEVEGLLRAANIARELGARWRTKTNAPTVSSLTADMIADAILEALR